MLRFFVFPFLVLTSVCVGAVVEWVPHGWGQGPDSYHRPVEEEDQWGSFFHTLRYFLAEEGYDLQVARRNEFGEGDLIIFNNILSERVTKRLQIIQKPSILINWEPPINDRLTRTTKFFPYFDFVFTWNESLIDHKRFVPFRYPALFEMKKQLPSFNDRKLCCLINTNFRSKQKNELYSERHHIAQFYDQLQRGESFFDLFGKKWDKARFYKLKSSQPKDKYGVLQFYRFNFAYENWLNDVGYITEKIFDCFVTGTIPIYLGETRIEKFIPQECFIDARRFDSLSELHHFLLAMDEKTWLSYQDAMREFIASEVAKQYTLTPLVEHIIAKVKELCPIDMNGALR